MQRALRTTTVLRQATRNFSSSPCWCQSTSNSDAAPRTPSTASTTSSSSSSPSPLPAYSLPIDAYTGTSTIHDHTGPPSTSSPFFIDGQSTPAPRSRQRQRQKQNLTLSEAQAFADLLGEIMPRSVGTAGKEEGGKGAGGGYATGSIFDLSGPKHQGAALNKAAEVAAGQVKDALMRRMGGGGKSQLTGGKWERSHKARDELTEQEELELDRLKEELMGLKTDREALLWGMRNVFGFNSGVDGSASGGGDVFPNPARLASSPPSPPTPTSSVPTSTLATGPSSPLYPHLLHHLFLLLRDTFSSPLSALSLFSLAASNPYSYINGCTPSLYSEVLRTRWMTGGGGEGDVQGVLDVLEEMRASGVTVDDKGRDLVRQIGEAIRTDGERAELRVEHLVATGELSAELTPEEKEKEVERRRWFGEKEREAWGRMEEIVEEVLEEVERARREKEDEKRRAEEVSSVSPSALTADYADGLQLPGRRDDRPPARRRSSRYGADDYHSDAEVDFRTSPPARLSRRTSSPYDERVDRSPFSPPTPRRRGRAGWEEKAGGGFRRRGEREQEEETGEKERHPALWWKQ